jgi:signal transduction histidine kinase
MRLTNRLSLLFLTALAIVLAGFSLTLYFLVSAHLYEQLDERLHAATKALVAAVEVHPQDVQWEPLERRITVGEDAAADQPRWTLYDLSGALKDRSFNMAPEMHGAAPRAGWRVLVRQMRAGNFAAVAINGKENAYWAETFADSPIGDATTASLPDDRTFLSDGLVITVALSEAPVLAMLQWLALALAVVSAAIWAAAALWGRWLCQRALRPISQMALSARSIRSEVRPPRMLDVPHTRDELEDLGQAFNELLADLRESLERQRRFTGDASHQLRTPLTALLASVDVALRHERSSEEYQRVLKTVSRRGGQLRQIIESLLFLARADGSAMLGTPERIELNGWCETWLDSWAEHSRRADISFRASPELAVTMAHPGLLGQVLDNLLDNACKYSEPGTPIGVAVEVTPSHIGVTVSDAGCGIAADQQAKIFEPFFRATEACWHGTAGIGLGLSVVQRLVAILGARVEVISEPGKGSCFKVLLPSDKEFAKEEERVNGETAKAG